MSDAVDGQKQMNSPEHLTAEAVERYRERRSSAAELSHVQAHVSVCAGCRAQLAHAIDADAAILSLRGQITGGDFNLDDEPLHLPYEQLALYVDNKLDEVEREIADSHLAICEECAGDLADLRRYQVIVAAESKLQNKQTASAAIAETAAEPLPTAWPARRVVSEKTAASWWQRLLAFDFFPASGALVPAGIAAVIIAVLLLSVWLATRTENKDDVAKVQPPNQNIVTPSPVTATPSPSTQSSSNNNASPAQNQNSPGEQKDSAPPPQPAPRRDSQGSAVSDEQTMALNDGGERVTFDSEGNFAGLESQPASVREAVRRSVQAQRAQTPPALETIAEGSIGVLMSGSAEATNNGVPFALVSPIGKVVRESQPTLSWQPLAGAKSYTVAIVDAKFRVVAQSHALTATSWTPDQALPRGANYSWQVTALQEDGTKVVSPVAPAPQAKFRVMEQTAFDEVTRMETSGVRSHLARGVVYAEAGLLDEARAEFAALVRDNPRSQLARRLLSSVKK
ncbi:MAG: zf-HC2 domain-containing protein [Pyrinomonadaceae bacterium]|nr:zf-HC2 domain-containing protein [Pyrinomonadaceae bacterium]